MWKVIIVYIQNNQVMAFYATNDEELATKFKRRLDLIFWPFNEFRIEMKTPEPENTNLIKSTSNSK